MKRVLVTGIAGFMGSHMADEFLALGYEVVGIDNLLGGYLENIPQEVNFVNADLADMSRIEEAFTNVDLVVHAACTAYEGLSVFSPALVVQNTMQITATTLSLSVKHGVKKFIYLSSMARYGDKGNAIFHEEMIPNPQDPYGISKVAAENLVKNVCETHGLDYVILVPHNIIGPRQKFDDPFRNVASIMVNRMLQGKQPIVYGDGNQVRCFSFMKDVTKPCVEASLNPLINREVINVGPDEEFVTINQLVELLADIMNIEAAPIYMPGRPREVFHATCSSEKARRLLGYETSTSLRSGLTELVNWISEVGPRPFVYHLPLEFITTATPETWTKKLI